MIIQCQSCAAKYFLPEAKVPVDPLKVRCPKCRAVFMLAGRSERAEAAAVATAAQTTTAGAARESAPVTPVFAGSKSVELEAEMPASATIAETVPASVHTAPAGAEATAAEVPAAHEVETMIAGHEAPVAPAPAPAPAKAEAPARSPRGGKSADDRAKRLARVLVSDILWYNRERRDAALRDGTLMTSLGEEIKKSWELYKEKVGPEAAHSTNYFKEALNEILADGQQVF